MRRNLLTAGALVAVLGLAACGGESEEPAAEAPAAGAQTPAASAPAAEPEMPAATTAQGFAMRAALSDMFEIESSRLALERSQADEVKAFAQRMITEHQSMTNQMQAALQQAGITVAPPAQLDADRMKELEDLRGSGPTDFDDRYIDQQRESHENARNLFRDYAGNGDTPVLQQFAERGVSMIENHLQTVEALDKSEADDRAGREDGNATLDRNAGAARTANRN